MARAKAGPARASAQRRLAALAAGCMRAVGAALVGVCVVAPAAAAGTVSFRAIGVSTSGVATNGRDTAGWVKPDGRLVMLRDRDPRGVSVPIPSGCVFAALGHDTAQVSCPTSPSYPSRPPGFPVPEVYAFGAAGFAEVPGVGPFDVYNGVGAYWLFGQDCSSGSGRSGCGSGYLDWRTGRHVAAYGRVVNDLDSPDLRPLSLRAPEYRLLRAGGRAATNYQSLYVKQRGRPRALISRCRQRCMSPAINNGLAIWIDGRHPRVYRADKQRFLKVSVPRGTRIAGLALTDRRLFITAYTNTRGIFDVLVARAGALPTGRAIVAAHERAGASANAARCRRGHTVAQNQAVRVAAIGHSVFACSLENGRRTRLGARDAAEVVVSNVLLGGRFVSYQLLYVGSESSQGPHPTQRLRLVDAYRAGAVRVGAVGCTPASPGEGNRLTDIALNGAGVLAWICATGDGATSVGPVVREVHVRDHSGPRLVASDPTITPGSLALVATTSPSGAGWAYWRAADQSYSVGVS